MKHQQSATFSPKQQRAAALLATGLTARATATKVGVNVRTVHVWRDNPAFLKLIGHYQAKLIDRVLGKLAGSGRRAVDTLVECLKSEDGDAIRVRTATAILDQLIKIRDNVDFDRRLSEVERQMERVKP